MAGVASFALAGFALGALFGVLILFALFHWVGRRSVQWEAIAHGRSQTVTDAACANATRLAPTVSIASHCRCSAS
jgi:hypothetical protein